MCCTVTMYHVLCRYYVPCAVPLLCTMCCTVTMYMCCTVTMYHVLYRYYVPCAVPLIESVYFAHSFFLIFFVTLRKMAVIFLNIFPRRLIVWGRKSYLQALLQNRERRLLASWCLFLHIEQLGFTGGIIMKFVREYVSKICRKNSSFINILYIGQNNEHFAWQLVCISDGISLFFLEREYFRQICKENQHIHFVLNNLFFPKVVSFTIWGVQTTADNMAHAHCNAVSLRL